MNRSEFRFDDRKMWDRLFSMVHRSDDWELYRWLKSLYAYVLSDAPEDNRSPLEKRRPPENKTTAERLDFGRVFEERWDFDHLIARTLATADKVPEKYGRLLRLVSDCEPAKSGNISLIRQEREGASYKSLAAIGYAGGLDKSERANFYRVCERIPLPQRLAGHILSRLREGVAA